MCKVNPVCRVYFTHPKELQHQGAEGVILGCTELPILISESDVDIPLFDTGKIHAHTAVEWSIKN